MKASRDLQSFVAKWCFGGCFAIVLSLGLAVGAIFLSFWIGWRIQLDKFVAQNSPLVSYGALFAVPAVADPWPVFSCFLFGALILAACVIAFMLLLMCCCGTSALCCFRVSNSEEAEEFLPIYSARDKFYSA